MVVKRFNSLTIDPIWVVILVVTAFLLFYRLDHRPFWQDEAETACLARNVLKYGVPRAFDGVNLISQEECREFGPDYLWRWSPWLQIYVAAAAFRLGGLATAVGRWPFAVFGFLSLILVYYLVNRYYGDRNWARLAAALLALSVPFLLFSRQCRYYALGTFLVMVSLYAFRGPWQSRWGWSALLVGALVLLFHTNYLLFFSYTFALGVGAVLIYRPELPRRRTLALAVITALLLLPSLGFYRLRQQTGMLDLTLVPKNLLIYFANLFQFILPLPVAAGLFWRWRRSLLSRAALPNSPGERFCLFLGLIILVNILVLALVPQHEFRYLIHLLPLGAIILGWTVCQVGRYHKMSGIILALLLGFTNFLYIIPMEWLGIANRPWHNDCYRLTYPNLPLKLYLTELVRPYPDVNQNLIRFFQTQAHPGDTILTTYGDLPLQFYTSCKVGGALQGRVPFQGDLPDWVVKRFNSGRNREKISTPPERYIRQELRLSRDYQTILLPYPDEKYGNRADPYYHRFVPDTDPINRITIYRKKVGAVPDAS